MDGAELCQGMDGEAVWVMEVAEGPPPDTTVCWAQLASSPGAVRGIWGPLPEQENTTLELLLEDNTRKPSS